jgi:pyrimidine-nucleoside phosphorylase
MTSMPTIVETIEAKRDGRELTDEQIRDAVSGFTSGTVPDYQMSALLMAITLRGMTVDESIALTAAMIASGNVLNLSSIPGTKFDKHSTGGVGDKVSLAFVPIIAAAGLPIAKMSGRGLGLTGGTLDKLESINGFQVSLSAEEIVAQVRAIGACICAQTDSIAPADKLIYALRDVTGTVESIPLIASSVMSKKIAGGSDYILIDLKVGRGAFIKNITDARQLADLMQTIGESHGKKVVIELTNMNVPLGRAVGNLVEVKEAADLLRGGEVDPRLNALIIHIAQGVLDLAGSDATVQAIISSGAAWQKFTEIVEAQGGDIGAIDRWDDVVPVEVVRAETAGYVCDIDAEIVGRMAMQLGAGRAAKDDCIDPKAGVWLSAGVGEYVSAGGALAKLYGDPNEAELAATNLRRAYRVSDDHPELPPLVIDEFAIDRS